MKWLRIVVFVWVSCARWWLSSGEANRSTGKCPSSREDDDDDDDGRCPEPKNPSAGDAAARTPHIPEILRLPDMKAILSRGLDVSGDQLHSSAMRVHSEGRLSIAVQLFAVTTKMLPFAATVWTNFGYVLLDLAEQPSGLPPNSADARTAVVCEAVAALELAIALGGDRAALEDVVQDGLRLLGQPHARDGRADGSPESRFEAVCVEPRGARYGRARKVVSASSQLSSLQLTQALCSRAGGVTVRPPEYERQRGVLSAATVLEILALFRFCGVVAVEDLLPAGRVDGLRHAVEGVFADQASETERLVDEHRAKTHAADGRVGKVEGERLALRDKSGMDARWELKLPLTEAAFYDSGVPDNSMLVPLASFLMAGPNVVLDTFSTVVSLPGCPVGHWHADVEDPFFYYSGITANNHRKSADARGAGAGTHLPPPAVIAVVPLVPVGQPDSSPTHNTDNGPTEFLMGSHIPPAMHDGDSRWWERHQNARSQHILPLELPIPAKPGTAILFDIRIRHRGGPNRSQLPRPILYLGYTMRWFRDAANFIDPHTVWWDGLLPKHHENGGPSPALGTARRNLYSRLDTQEYTKMLERELVQVLGEEYLATIKAASTDVGGQNIQSGGDSTSR